MTERIEVVERTLQHMFHRVLAESVGEPPHLREVRVEWDDYNDCLRLRARFQVEGQEDRFAENTIAGWNIAGAEASARARQGNWFYEAGALWSRMYEDHYVRRAVQTAERHIFETTDPAEAHARLEAVRGLREHMVQHHRAGPEQFRPGRAFDFASFDEAAEITPESVATLRESAQARLAQRMEEQMLAAMGMPATSNAAEQGTTTLTLERMREAARALSQNPYHDDWQRAFVQDDYSWARATAYYGHRVVVGMDFAAPDVGSAEAQQRGLALLKEHLTPEQKQQYEQHNYFDVKGGESGKTYRINHGRQMNIHELGEDGQPVVGWCFLPQGGLVAGDVMLAQKAALELFERKALKIANRFGVIPGGPPERVAGVARRMMDYLGIRMTSDV